MFQDVKYLGYKEEFTRSSNLGYLNNQMSSVKVIKGNWELFENQDYSGDHILVCEGEELSVLPSQWSFRVSSVKYTEICGKNFLLR